jgi:tetratricopeptide (TPR) repeat protein
MVNHDAIEALEALFQQHETSASGKEASAQGLETYTPPHALIQQLDATLSQWGKGLSQGGASANLIRHSESLNSSTVYDYETFALQAVFYTVYGTPRLANRYIYKAMNHELHATHPLQWMVHLSLAHQQVLQGVFREGYALATQTFASIPKRYHNLRHHALNLQTLALTLKKSSFSPMKQLYLGWITLQQWSLTLDVQQANKWPQVLNVLLMLCSLAIMEFRRVPYPGLKTQCDAITRQAHLSSIIIHATQLDCGQLAWASGLKRIKRALRRMPSQPMLWMELARVYRLIGHTDKVHHALEKAVSLMPTLVIAQVELGLTLAERGEIANAMERFSLAYIHAVLPSQKRRLAYIMADALERHGQRLGDTLPGHEVLWPELSAEVAILNKLDQEGSKPTAATLSHLAKLANTLEQKELAVLACNLAIEHISTPNAQCYINLAFSAWQANLIEMAVFYYRKALRLDDTNALAHNNLGSIYLDHVHDLEAAQIHFRSALKNNSGFALAHFNMGRLNTRLQHYTEAAHSFACAKAANRLTHELRIEEIDHHLHLLFDRM